MRHRLFRGFALVAAACLATFFGAAAAAAEGYGDPHATDARGNPHMTEATGNPHVVADVLAPAGAATTTAEAVATVVASASASVAAASDQGNKPAAPPQVGKPANGTVGNADGKQPRGQSPNDKNKGYECDGNKGIGKGNPAHSGCQTTTPSTTTTPTVTPEPAATAVLGVQLTRSSTATGSLARTGEDTTAWTGTGLLLVVTGAVLLTSSRRRVATA